MDRVVESPKDGPITELLTSGYEGLTIDGWVNVLVEAAVQLVVDTRYRPLSRKRGFSKTAMAGFLRERGIEYVHLGRFGAPPDLRAEYKETGDWGRFSENYVKRLEILYDELGQVLRLTQSRRTCLLCFERDPNFCHRSLLADRLIALSSADFEVKVVHL